MRRLEGLLSLLVVCLLVCSVSPALGAIYVKWDSPNNGPGNDWAHAYHTVTAALTAAVSGNEIWVAGDAAHPYVERVTLKAGVGLYGGFAGTESLRNQRNWSTNVTVLDGNQGGSVVTSPSGATASTVIDGFTIRNGSASASGGGIYSASSAPTIANNIITANTAQYGNGGGIYAVSSLTISNNTITGNTAMEGYGGGIYCSGNSPIISNNIIRANTATEHYESDRAIGGGIYCSTSSAVISGNIIMGNTAVCGGGGIGYSSGSPVIRYNTIANNDGQYAGGGIYCSGSASIYSNRIAANVANTAAGIYCISCSPSITNNTITANTAPSGHGGIYCYSSSAVISNNIVAFNLAGIGQDSGAPVLKNNCVYNPGGYNYSGLSAGATDIQADPKLVSVQYGQLHIQPDSPCKDTGYDAAAQAGWLDMDGQARIQGSHVDMGADESDGTIWTFAPTVIRVSPSGNDSNDGSSWPLAKRTVQAGAYAASAQGGEVWVAAGTYSEQIVLPAFAGIFGGFVGTESVRSDRNWTSHVTVLDGGGVGCVITAQAASNAIDGFTIQHGASTSGGGIYCNYGSPAISNNTIKANTATTGGGICGRFCSPAISNNVITANTATGDGGGINLDTIGRPTMSNNTVTANSATNAGGIAATSDSTISNNIVAFNSSGIRCPATPVIKNNCVYNPKGYNYSGFSAGTSDIQIDPKLVAVQFGQLHIQPDSPCRDAGDDSVVQSGWVDMDGQARIQGAHVDIGADESDGTSWAYTPFVVRVSPTGIDSNDGSSWASAKRTVQAGANTASAQGGEVWVAAGTYNERIVVPEYVSLVGGFAGTEASREERDSVLHVAVLDGGGAGSVVTAQAVSAIDGFTIQHGATSTGGGVYCSGMVVISNNTITANTASGYGGGVYCYSGPPMISNNTIKANSAVDGGGICCYAGSPTISDNAITANTGASYGGAIYCQAGKPTIANNTMVANVAGSGTVYCYAGTPAISSNIVAFNSSGIFRSNGAAYPALKNNCVYNPGGTNYGGNGLVAGATDIQLDPKLVAVQYGQLHIQPSSPCKDTGYDAAVQADWFDMDGQARIQGAHVDIGADETDGTTWIHTPFVVRVSPSGSDTNDGSSWASAKRTVQAGANAASAQGGEVWVAAGTYAERITLPAFTGLFGGFAGTESARSSRDWIAHATVLDGGRAGSVITAQSGSSSVDGFTIQQGTSTNGGGIYCSSAILSISNNTITTNTASGSGGGIYCYSSTSPTITHNTITANTSSGAGYGGGGIFCSGGAPTISYNVITANTASPGGGICCRSNAPTISNNTIATNSATEGAGIYCSNSSPVIANNTITANTATNQCGGVYCYSASAVISNNIIAFNSSGLYKYGSPAPVLRNNCVYNPSGYNYSGLSAGTGCISADPLLTADYHLPSNSPCVEGGWNSASGITTYDMDGQPRVNGTIDIGADEYWASMDAIGAKSAGDGPGICIAGAVVTASFADYFYIEADNRAGGIRINKTGHTLAVGMRADVFGTPATHDGERCIDATDAHQSDAPNQTGSVDPLILNSRSLGGSVFGLQDGITGAKGLSNIGLLVRICGKVAEIEPVTEPALPSWFKISDGTGATIKCVVPSGVTIDPSWAHVAVTGISSCETVGSELHSLLRVRTQTDIVPH